MLIFSIRRGFWRLAQAATSPGLGDDELVAPACLNTRHAARGTRQAALYSQATPHSACWLSSSLLGGLRLLRIGPRASAVAGRTLPRWCPPNVVQVTHTRRQAGRQVGRRVGRQTRGHARRHASTHASGDVAPRPTSSPRSKLTTWTWFAFAKKNPSRTGSVTDSIGSVV